MKAILVDETVKVYTEPSDQNLSLATLRKGDEFELGKVTRKKGVVWVEITMSSGQKGYVLGTTHIFEFKTVQLLTDGVELREAANAESNLVKTFHKNDVITAVGVEKDDDKGWVKIIDRDGNNGYIKGGARIRYYQEPTKNGGKKLMITGGIFGLMGVAFYIFSLITSQVTGNMAILMVAVLAFGLLQFVQGLMEYNKAKKAEINKK
jgi:uncharacterized protein YgiM (DUF1202 family)